MAPEIFQRAVYGKECDWYDFSSLSLKCGNSMVSTRAYRLWWQVVGWLSDVRDVHGLSSLCGIVRQ
jgi:hypothetical protein